MGISLARRSPAELSLMGALLYALIKSPDLDRELGILVARVLVRRKALSSLRAQFN